MNADPLISTLIDLVRTMGRPDFKLILGGGFGLYLKQLHLQSRSDVRTLLPGNLWPYPRATEDLDLFLPTEVVISLSAMQALRRALDALNFMPVADAKFLHFVKPWGLDGRVKIDMLTGPLPDSVPREQIKYTHPRIRPRGALELHAYLTTEALDFEDAMSPLIIDGVGSDGQPASVTVHVPQPFTFILMKLHAFADRVEDADDDLGRHHALDVYRIVAMLTEREYDDIGRGVLKHDGTTPIMRAREIVSTHFSKADKLGILRLQEHQLFDAKMDVSQLIASLTDLFR